MKRTTILYWIITGLFAAFMLFSAIPDAIKSQEAVAFITGIGYPEYFVRFIGIVKILGVIAILIPGFPRIKEWAYAGLFFDLAGAVFSLIASTGKVDPQMSFMLLPLGLLFWSYYLYHKKYSETAIA